MNIQVRCLSCDRKYVCFYDNTRIYTSIIETKCPVCGHQESRNISKFLDLQTDHCSGYYPKIAVMISMARQLEEQLNSDEIYRNKQRKKK